MSSRNPFGLALLLVATTALSACNEKKAVEVKKPERPVVVAAVAYEPRHATRSFVGTIRPRIEADLGFRVTGKVEKRFAEVGDVVKAGQVLATLDPIDLGLQRDQAEAELNAALGAQKQTNADYERVSQLRKQGWSTGAELDKQRAALDEVNGRVLRDQHALTLSKNSLAYAELKADSDGVITATMAEPGQVLASGTSAFRVARAGEKEAVVALPEAFVERARNAQASVTLWSDGKARYQAKLRELSPSADVATRTYQARFTLLDKVAGAPRAADAALKSSDPGLSRAVLGMTATVTLEDQDKDRVARLPLSALYNQGRGPSLWVVTADGGLELKPVEVEGYDARDVLVKSGVAEGDKVVTLGVQKLDAGQKVRISSAF